MAKRSAKPANNGGGHDSDNSGPGNPAAGGDGSNPGSGGDGGSGSGDSDGSVITPRLGDSNGDGNSDGNGGTGGSEPGPKRGRPRGSTGQKKTELDLSVVIEFANFGLGQIVGDAWAMDGGETQQFSAAAQKVLRHYDTPAFSAKAMDWVGLIMVVGKIYGPRIAHAVANQPARPAQTTQGPGAPGPAPRQKEPRQPVMQQGDGFVTISNPNGDGTLINVPVGN